MLAFDKVWVYRNNFAQYANSNIQYNIPGENIKNLLAPVSSDFGRKHIVV